MNALAAAQQNIFYVQNNMILRSLYVSEYQCVNWYFYKAYSIKKY